MQKYCSGEVKETPSIAATLNKTFKLKRILIVVLCLHQVSFIPSGISRSDEIRDVGESLDYQHYQDTQKGIPLDLHVVRRDNVLKTEFISDPIGALQMKSVQLISPEGKIYLPKKTYEVSEQAARNLGRLRPIPVRKAKKSKSSMGKIGSALLGAGLSTALSGLGSPHSTAYSAGHYGAEAAKDTSSGLSTVGLVSGLAPVALLGTGNGRHAPSEEIEWMEPKTAGTGIFSSVAEFECPAPSSSEEPWQLKAEMEDRKGSWVTYTFDFYPVPPPPSLWEEKIQLTGPSSKLL